VIFIQAKCYCPKHGRLELGDIVIKNGIPTCSKCSSPLEFGTVKPRYNFKKK
jgi:ribosomal protein L37AE/L43A